MIVELDINGAKVIISGENLSISVTEDQPIQRGPSRKVSDTAHALTRYREANGLTLEQFGAKIGACKSMMSKWERGKFIPRSRYMRKIVAETGGAVTANDWYEAAQ